MSPKGIFSNPARRVQPLVFSYLLLLVVCAFDFATSHEMRLGTFYLLVVAFASWNLSPRQAITHAVATSLFWSLAEYLSGMHFSATWLVYWNVFNHLGVVSITATLVLKAKTTIDRQHRLIRDLGQTLLKVNQFKELVPVCRLCREVRFDDNYRARLDKFMEENIETDSVGHVCPACLVERASRLASISAESRLQTDAV